MWQLRLAWLPARCTTLLTIRPLNLTFENSICSNMAKMCCIFCTRYERLMNIEEGPGIAHVYIYIYCSCKNLASLRRNILPRFPASSWSLLALNSLRWFRSQGDFFPYLSRLRPHHQLWYFAYADRNLLELSTQYLARPPGSLFCAQWKIHKRQCSFEHSGSPQLYSVLGPFASRRMEWLGYFCVFVREIIHGAFVCSILVTSLTTPFSSGFWIKHRSVFQKFSVSR